MKVLVTGSAGFIGSAVTLHLLDRGDEVVGIDNLSDYYDVNLKKARLGRHLDNPRYRHAYVDLADRHRVDEVFAEHRPQRVINLAAQAGVRYAMENPHVYVSSNVTGFLHILENCRHLGVEHLVYASTSSVYGANTKLPFSVHESTEHPLTLYAATKKANEMMAHSYAHLYGIPCTGLRFFTVYGPWGRPDMALFLFTKALLAGQPLRVFNEGRHTRDFTYVDDIVQGVVRVLDRPPSGSAEWSGQKPDPASSAAPYRLYNIGNQEPIPLLRYIEVLEECLGRKAQLELLPLQPGDVPDTEADVADLVEDVGYRPVTSVDVGVRRFVDWYRAYFRV
jgi:UDP-glucuronate 4-epimerase